ncbi:LysR substrate-binding domain-containing protein [Spirosoma terrae]|uniref:LysR family transcriptional regulator n=1 Tax=Spirosoma terrae TaxID=1968276 RepID=A0A6L9LCD9_9BACT|nr:LysR substrate-binding domain-containing protein [Spirosoma terrae]NDU96493.1 LysR family transcriptional regulator [Spirosoma terrae]
MELRQLKYFVRAAERLNFTKAADDLCITQSTLSHQIKELENTLNVLLFDRIGKRVKLTEAGEIMLPYARKTIHQAEEGQQFLQDLNELKAGKLIIGATYGLTELLIQALAPFNQAYPNVQIQIVFGSTADMLLKIKQYEIDCMLSFLPSSYNDSDLDIVKLFDSTLSLIVHESHPWSQQKQVTLQKVAELPLVLPSPSYSIRNFLDDVLAKNNISLNVTMEINDIHSLLKLTNTRQWNTILMNSSLFDFAELKAIPLEGSQMQREATITFPADVYRKKAVVAFTKLLTNHF